jgi:hypothetical protein
MKSRTVSIGRITLAVAEGWDEITATLEDSNAPATLADPDSGVGALQFSPAIYEGGAMPHVTSQDLCDLLSEFAVSRGLELPFDHVIYADDPFVVGASFHSESDFIRVWYCSDGKNIILATYVCEWNQRDIEAESRELAVRSIRFNETPLGN